MILNIYIGFGILTFVMCFMQSYIISEQLKRKYPEIVNEFKKNNKSGVLEQVFTWTKIFVCCFVPLINVGIFYVSLFDSKKTEEKLLNDVLKK